MDKLEKRSILMFELNEILNDHLLLSKKIHKREAISSIATKGERDESERIEISNHEMFSLPKYDPLLGKSNINATKIKDSKCYDSILQKEPCTYLNLDNQDLVYLTGIPNTVIQLSLKFNQLCNLTSFMKLTSLRVLDVSHNSIESLTILSSLPQLQELCADYNAVDTLMDLQDMGQLTKLSLRHNRLKEIDWENPACRCTLKTLDLSYNAIEKLHNLENLACLENLFLEHNHISDITLNQPLMSLQLLDLKSNPLSSFDPALFPNVRQLSVSGESDLWKGVLSSTTESLNLSGQKMTHSLLKQFVISCILPLKTTFVPFNLTSLIIQNAQLDKIPKEFITLFSTTLRYLDLSRNQLRRIENLSGLSSLEYLDVSGNQLKHLWDILICIRPLIHLTSFNSRGNPITNMFYQTALENWQQYCCQNLNDDITKVSTLQQEKKKQLLYRSVLVRCNNHIHSLDKWVVSDMERTVLEVAYTGLKGTSDNGIK